MRNGPALKFLLVEDNKMVAEVVRDTLETEGWEVETYADGGVALTKIAGDTHYDLLLLDYDLPGVNGIELVQQARNLAHRRDTPIIVMSVALGETAARNAGANEFVRKPGDIRSLVGTITELLGSNSRLRTSKGD